jgi:deoxyribodipyrimidine photo-lyase
VTHSIESALVWFRRDLRTMDHAALHHALRSARQVWCVFVFDHDILDPLPACDRRVAFIHASVSDLHEQLTRLSATQGVEGGGLMVRHARAAEAIPSLAASLGVQAVFANHDDDPAALERDARVQRALAQVGIAWHSSKDHVIFERSEVLTGSGTPYSVFTPYKTAWLRKLDDFFVKAYPVDTRAGRLSGVPIEQRQGLPALADIGFGDAPHPALPCGSGGAAELLGDFLTRIDRYDEQRNFPAVKGPSYLSVHLRFGTVSIRELVRLAWQRSQAVAGSGGAAVWLSELIWRDFYHQVLHHHPHVVTQCFKAEFDALEWEQGPQAEARFAAWCEGRTGYPLVDAAMAQLNQTGYMHNRLRMVVASFFTKDLGLDWRWGEAYFARTLLDYDLAANNGGWQWAASTGCDAQPWFRIFNPVRQSEKFDPRGQFIRRYLPQLAALPDAHIHAPWLARPVDLEGAGISLGKDYARPVVQHDEARVQTLARFQRVKDMRS